MLKKLFFLLISCIALNSTSHAIEFVNGLSGFFSSSIEETDNPNTIRRIFEIPKHKMSIDLPGKDAPLLFEDGHFYVSSYDPKTSTIVLVNIFEARKTLKYNEVRKLLAGAFGKIAKEHKGSGVADTYFIIEETDKYGNEIRYKWYMANNYLFSVVGAAIGPDYKAQLARFDECLNTVVWKKA